MILDEIGNRLFQFRTVLSERPGDRSPGVRCNIFVDLDVLENLRPELCLVAVHNDDRHQPGINHFEQVFVIKLLRGELELHLRLSRAAQGIIESGKVFEVAAGLAHEDFFVGKIIGAADVGRARTGDDRLAYVARYWGREIDQLPALRGDGEIRRSDIPAAIVQRGQQLVAAHGHEDDTYRQVARLELLIEILFECSQPIVARAVLRAFVNKIECLAVDDRRADHAAIRHTIEVACPGPLDALQIESFRIALR